MVLQGTSVLSMSKSATPMQQQCHLRRERTSPTRASSSALNLIGLREAKT